MLASGNPGVSDAHVEVGLAGDGSISKPNPPIGCETGGLDTSFETTPLLYIAAERGQGRLFQIFSLTLVFETPSRHSLLLYSTVSRELRVPAPLSNSRPVPRRRFNSQQCSRIVIETNTEVIFDHTAGGRNPYPTDSITELGFWIQSVERPEEVDIKEINV